MALPCEEFHKQAGPAAVLGMVVRPSLRPPRFVSPKVSDSTVRRLSQYLRILEGSNPAERSTLSSDDLAEEAGTTAAQVRKDLSLFGSFGKRGMGYRVDELEAHLRGILGLRRAWRVALVGAGRIGAALFEYGDFRRRGFDIVAVLDQDPAKIGTPWGPVVVDDVAALEEVIRKNRIEVAILAVPQSAAQEVTDRLVASGVRGLLNFAPAQLRVPAGVSVQDVNLVTELEALSFDITHSNGNGAG